VIVGVVGAGALGTVFGAALARTAEVRVLAHDTLSARAIASRDGLVVDDEPPRQVRVSHDPAVFEGVTIVLVAVKTFATIEALEPLRAQVGHGVPVVSLQNGIDAVEQIDFAFDHERCIGLGPTTEAAELIESGRARRAASGTTHFGWAADHPGGAELDELAEACRDGGLVIERAQPIEPFVWAKLVANAAINPLTALAGVRNGELLERPDLRERARRIASEVGALAQRVGITLPFSDPVAHVESVALATAANRSSMLVDLEAHRPTEIEAISGAIVRRAASAGLPVPENLRVLDEVRARERA
jgi:2-dehydropantoate 2-reductase